MKTLKFLTTAILTSLLIASCSDDDDNGTPEEIIEEELITTMTVTLTPEGGGTTVTLKTLDIDGDGPGQPVITVSDKLVANTSYEGSIELLNETEDPAEDITEEVDDLAEEHQFFYTIGNGLDANTEYEDFDKNDYPVGLEFNLETGDASTGTLTFTLRHEPKKPNTGLEDAGGTTDISATFNVEIEETMTTTVQ